MIAVCQVGSRGPHRGDDVLAEAGHDDVPAHRQPAHPVQELRSSAPRWAGSSAPTITLAFLLLASFRMSNRVGTRVPRYCLPNQAARVQRPDLVQGQRRHRAGAVGGAVDGLVVHEDGHVAVGEAYVELQPPYAGSQRLGERRVACSPVPGPSRRGGPPAAGRRRCRRRPAGADSRLPATRPATASSRPMARRTGTTEDPRGRVASGVTSTVGRCAGKGKGSLSGRRRAGAEHLDGVRDVDEAVLPRHPVGPGLDRAALDLDRPAAVPADEVVVVAGRAGAGRWPRRRRCAARRPPRRRPGSAATGRRW